MQSQTVRLNNGITYEVVKRSPLSHEPGKPTLFCLHGFPDQWYGWKVQVEAWSKAGYPVVVPHMLGYGRTAKPLEAEAYSAKNICSQLAAVMDHLQLEKVVVLGHDWGAAIAWRFALWFPERLIGLVVMSVPYFPPQKRYIPPNEASKRAPTFAYQEYFADPDSTQEIEANLDTFLSAIFQAPQSDSVITNTRKTDEGGLPIPVLREGQMQRLVRADVGSFRRPPMVLTLQELEQYKQDFRRDGMHGPLSYYRTTQTRFEEEKGQNLYIQPSLPILFMYGTKDKTCPSTYVNRMSSLSPNLTTIPLEEIGHWVLLEAPTRIVDEVLSFLDQLAGTPYRNSRKTSFFNPRL